MATAPITPQAEDRRRLVDGQVAHRPVVGVVEARELRDQDPDRQEGQHPDRSLGRQDDGRGRGPPEQQSARASRRLRRASRHHRGPGDTRSALRSAQRTDLGERPPPKPRCSRTRERRTVSSSSSRRSSLSCPRRADIAGPTACSDALPARRTARRRSPRFSCSLASIRGSRQSSESRLLRLLQWRRAPDRSHRAAPPAAPAACMAQRDQG